MSPAKTLLPISNDSKSSLTDTETEENASHSVSILSLPSIIRKLTHELQKRSFDFGLLVSDECSDDVDGAVGSGSVSWVVDVVDIFKDVEEGFDEEALSPEEFFL